MPLKKGPLCAPAKSRIDEFPFEPEYMTRSTIIRVIGAEVYAHHGVGDAERELGGRYSFDLEIEADITKGAETDELHDTIDYVEAYEIARNVIVDSARRRLLESLVTEVADAVMARFPAALAITVRLRKLRAPINGVLEAVELEHRVER